MIPAFSVVAIALIVTVLLAIAFVVAIMVYIYVTSTTPLDYPYTTLYVDSDKLGPYYVSLASKLGMSYKMDEHGGALIHNALTNQYWFNPLPNTHQALAHYERYLKEGNGVDLRTFFRFADAIIANGVRTDDGMMVWHYPVESFPGQRLPWLSAMAQGQVLLVMTRAYEESRDERYLRTAYQAVKCFAKNIDDGGVRCLDPKRGVFYEEYAYFEEGKRHHTLNGMLSALMGVYDLWKITRDPDVRRFFEEGVATIRNNLMAYEFPFCSSYDLRHEHGDLPLFQARYHAVHVTHLRVLAALTGDHYFAEVADRWNHTLHSPLNRLQLVLWYLTFKRRAILLDCRLKGGLVAGLRWNLQRFLGRFVPSRS